MNIEKATSIYFSPTESTKKILSIMTENLPLPSEEIDLTSHCQNNRRQSFSSREIVILGIPVYGGRVPAIAVERMQKMQGRQTPAILVATYGNRAYDDALLELADIARENGFIPVAAGAFITEHSIMHSVAQGRPDEADNEKIIDFTLQAWGKIQNAEDISQLSLLKISGNTPYLEYKGASWRPQTDQNCNQCGICAENCPVNAISATEPDKTDDNICISCLRCIKLCPQKARKLDQARLSAAEKAFAEKFSIRKEPEIFI